jgi:adenosylcobinamide kinase / adenosylcobinamide-phosphate guanylyltransferase
MDCVSMGEVWFVTGGARSGKSRFAERLATASGREVVYLATMEPLDDELRERVAHHRASRPSAWQTVEAPRDPVSALASAEPGACVLLDCLSLWVTNRLLEGGDEPSWAQLLELERALDLELKALLDCARRREGPTILVTNEVGSSVVPETLLGRAFRDMLGRVNQQAAAAASRAWLLVSGRALELPAEV